MSDEETVKVLEAIVDFATALEAACVQLKQRIDQALKILRGEK